MIFLLSLLLSPHDLPFHRVFHRDSKNEKKMIPSDYYLPIIKKRHRKTDLSSLPLLFSFSSRLEEEEKEKGEIVRMENRNGPIRLLFTNYHEKTSKDRSRKIDSGFDLSSLPLSSPHPPSTFVPSWFEEQEENRNGPIQLLFTNYQRKRHRKIDFGFDLSSHPLSFPHLQSTFPWFEEEEEEEKEKKVKLYEWKIPSDYYLPIIKKRR